MLFVLSLFVLMVGDLDLSARRRRIQDVCSDGWTGNMYGCFRSGMEAFLEGVSCDVNAVCSLPARLD